MSTPDQETLLRAVEDARRILGEYIEPGQRDAKRRLPAVLDKNVVVRPGSNETADGAAPGRLSGGVNASFDEPDEATLSRDIAHDWASRRLLRQGQSLQVSSSWRSPCRTQGYQWASIIIHGVSNSYRNRSVQPVVSRASQKKASRAQRPHPPQGISPALSGVELLKACFYCSDLFIDLTER
jgi:hypothetical protein